MDEPEKLMVLLEERVSGGLQEYASLDGETAYILGWEDAVANLRKLSEPVGGVGIIEYGEVSQNEP